MPRIPHTFGGYAYIDGEPAPIGTLVSVSAEKATCNSILITQPDGSFGLGTFDEKLLVTGIPVPGKGMYNVPEGTEILFYVDGKQARVIISGNTRNTAYYHSGHHTVVILHISTENSCCNKN